MTTLNRAFVGSRSAEVADEVGGAAIPLILFYPTLATPKPERFGPYTLDLAVNSEPQSGVFPLVVISHGGAGTPLVYRTLAHHLAANGFFIAMPEHPFNNRKNNSLGGKMQNLINRPRHICLTLNWLLEKGPFANCLKPDSVFVVGHSMGGYSALAAAGGNPTCFPKESPDGQSHQLEVMHDKRIKALVLMAPATVWFREAGALSGIDIPILLLVAEKDVITPAYHVEIVLNGVSDQTKIEHHEIENAGHFSFLSPFPEAMKRMAFEPAQDPAGFDRERFMDQLNDQITTFLRATSFVG